jgi:hypothetical protein
MPNSPAVCNSFKRELLTAHHNFGTTVTRGVTTADQFKMALFLATASLGASGNYTAGGENVTNANAPALDGATAHWTPSASVSWTNLTSSGAFDAALLYNSSQANRAVAVFTFSSQSVTAGNFSLTMPTNNGSTGLIRIG